MNDRYMVINPDTLEAMRRAGHAAKLEVRIEKLETALRRIIDRAEYRMGHHVTDAVCAIAREALGNKND
jgi:hypothetical protein